MVGVLPFLNADSRWEEVGLGMMCAGVGLALLAASPGVLRSQAAAVGRPGRGTLSVLLGAPRWAAPPLIGLGLLVAGLLLLADAFAGR